MTLQHVPVAIIESSVFTGIAGIPSERVVRQVFVQMKEQIRMGDEGSMPTLIEQIKKVDSVERQLIHANGQYTLQILNDPVIATGNYTKPTGW